MNRAERRRIEKQSSKYNLPAPSNVSNYTVKQISEVTGVRIQSLIAWKDARESEMMEEFTKEFQGKLWKAEDYIAVANILISLFAIKMTWGFTKSNQRFLNNINAAMEYVNRVGVKSAYDRAKQEMGIELEFDDMDINKEFGFGEEGR